MKVVTLEPDNALNRVVCMTAANFTLDGKLWNKLLGFSTPGTSLAGSATTYSPIIAANAAKIDSARAVAFHCPTLSAGAYSTSGVAPSASHAKSSRRCAVMVFDIALLGGDMTIGKGGWRRWPSPASPFTALAAQRICTQPALHAFEFVY